MATVSCVADHQRYYSWALAGLLASGSSTALRKAPVSAQAYRRPGRLCKVQLAQQVERSKYLERIGDNTQPAWVSAK
jgi:hypothetical protein